ncbi:MAG: hypothetical protein IZT60_00190 [Gammaproteobacteria bacterium]|nr:hypothetical protein [Gammaproteobacteria bacterium]
MEKQMEDEMGKQMEEKRKIGIFTTLLSVVIAFAIVLVLFYGLNHLIMGMQGLPLNMDLTPAG